MSDTGRSEDDDEIERDGDGERHPNLSPIEGMVADMENVVLPHEDRRDEDEDD